MYESGPKALECLADDDEKGIKYRGEIAVTTSGKECQVWNLQSPNKHGFTPGRYDNMCALSSFSVNLTEIFHRQYKISKNSPLPLKNFVGHRFSSKR